MTRTEHKRERDKRRLRRARRKKERDALTAHRSEHAIPDDPMEFYERYVWWPHKNKMKPVRGLNNIQRDLFERRTSFRLDAEGNRMFGLDIAVKPRQVFMTSVCLGMLIWAMVKFPGFQAVTVLHTAGKTSRKLWRRFKFALDHLPREWGSISGQSVGEMIEWSNGSTWSLYTAGAGENIAEKIALSSTIHGLHLSESGKYVYPEAVFAAVRPALADKTGWCIAECTPPNDRQHWHMQEYYAARDGHGQFTGALFWPWYRDEGIYIEEGDIRYQRMMCREFEDTRLNNAELEREVALGLNDGQKAWRRWHYSQGTPKSVRLNKREYPEDDENCFGNDDINSFLDDGALAIIETNTREPVYRERITSAFEARIYRDGPVPGYIIVGSDQATRDGEDSSTSELIDHETREQYAELQGHCFGEEHASALEWLVQRLLTGSELGYHEWLEAGSPYERHDMARRHVVCPDISRDCGLGPALEKSQMNCYRGTKADRKKRVYVKADYIGLKFDGRNRNEIINLISFWAEGPIDPLEPQCEIYSAALAGELRTLVDTGTKVEAAAHEHDDLAIAWGMAHYVANKTKVHATTTDPRPVDSPHDLNRQPVGDRTRASRRLGGPM